MCRWLDITGFGRMGRGAGRTSSYGADAMVFALLYPSCAKPIAEDERDITNNTLDTVTARCRPDGHGAQLPVSTIGLRQQHYVLC